MGARQRSGSDHVTRLQSGQFKLPSDENLTPSLVALARSRGFPAVHVNEINLQSVNDQYIARYAVDHGMAIVTSNMADFQRLHSRRKLHPGLIFLHCNVEEIFTDINQATMLRAVLDDVLQNDLVQEAIRIALVEDTGEDLLWELTRHPLPED